MSHTTTHRWRAAFAILALAAALSLASACSGGSDDAADSGGGPFGGAASDRPQNSSSEGVASGSDGARAPSGTTAGDSSTGGANPALLLDRKLIRTATMRIETDAVSEKFEEIGNIALSSGGLVFSSSFGNSGESQTASITIRIPGDRYEQALVQLRKLGEVREENSNSQDVTEDFTDLSSQLTNLQATERGYLELLGRAGTIDEILVVQDRLQGVRAQIEQTQGRINLLTNQTDLATITVHLAPPLAGPPAEEDAGATSPLEVAERAWEASLATLLGFAIVAIAIIAYGWWLLPIAAGAWYVYRQRQRADRERPEPPPASM
jgi:hypothetical protein